MSTKANFIQLLVSRGSCPEAVAWAQAHPGDLANLAECTNVEWWLILLSIGLKVGAVDNETALSFMDTAVKVAQPALPSSQAAEALRLVAAARGLSGYNPRLKSALGATLAAAQRVPSSHSRILAEVRTIVSPEKVMAALSRPS